MAAIIISTPQIFLTLLIVPLLSFQLKYLLTISPIIPANAITKQCPNAKDAKYIIGIYISPEDIVNTTPRIGAMNAKVQGPSPIPKMNPKVIASIIPPLLLGFTLNMLQSNFSTSKKYSPKTKNITITRISPIIPTSPTSRPNANVTLPTKISDSRIPIENIVLRNKAIL